MCSDGWFPSYVLEPFQGMSISGSSEVCRNISVWSELCTGKGRKVAHLQGSWLIKGNFYQPKQPEESRLLSPAWLRGRRMNATGRGWGREVRALMASYPVPFPDFISPILSLIGACQEMRVVGKAFKNTPGDNNSLVLKASLLENRRCIESSQLLSLWDFWEHTALPTISR